jgi:uncharacterized protein
VLLDQREWVDAARGALEFVLTHLRVDGRLMRSFRDGDVRHLAYCEDYAFVLEAALALYEATFDDRWLAEARWAADEAIRLFADDRRGGFFTTGSDAAALVTRPKDMQDNAVPSANSVLALELQRLAHFTGDFSYERHATGPMRLLMDWTARSPLGFGNLLGAIDFYSGDPLEIVLIGERDAPDTDSLLDRVRDRWIPNKVLLCTEDGALDVPLTQGRGRVDGRAAAYVCRNGVCDLPVTDPAALDGLLP